MSLLTVTPKDKQVRALMGQLRRQTENTRPAMAAIGMWYERRVLENFERQQEPDGTPWLPTKVLSNHLGFVGTAKGGKRRSAYTKSGDQRAAYRRYLANKLTLVLTGRMRSRIHHQADNDSVRIGVAGIEYAAIQQRGGMAGRNRKVKIPARAWLALNRGREMVMAPRDRDMAVGILTRHMTAPFK